MLKIKEPSVAGTFYTNDAEALKIQIETFAKENKNKYRYEEIPNSDCRSHVDSGLQQ